MTSMTHLPEQKIYTFEELTTIEGAAQRWTERAQKLGFRRVYQPSAVRSAKLQGRLTPVPNEQLPELLRGQKLPLYFAIEDVDAVPLRPETGRHLPIDDSLPHIGTCPHCKEPMLQEDKLSDWYWCHTCRKSYQSQWKAEYTLRMGVEPQRRNAASPQAGRSRRRKMRSETARQSYG